jgi:hypothetical protein
MSMRAYLVWSEGINRVTFSLWLNGWLTETANWHRRDSDGGPRDASEVAAMTTESCFVTMV